MTRKLGLGWLPLVLAATLGLALVPPIPIWLPAVTERFELSATQSGLLVSLELGSMALASMATAALSRANRGALLLVLAAALSAAGNLVSYFADSILLLTLARAVVGTCAGIALADITRRAAQMPNSHKVFSMQQLGVVIFAVTFFTTIPMLLAVFGPATPFLYNCALGVITLISIVWLPAPAAEAAAAPVDSAADSAKPSKAIGLTFLAIALSFGAQASLWTNIAVIAKEAGMPLDTLSQVLAIGAIFNLAAPLAAERVGLRWGRTAPLLLGYAGLGFSMLMIALPPGMSWFAAGAIGINLFLLFLAPFLLSILAGLDPSGRSAAAGPAFFTVGAAVGPAVGGIIVGATDFATLGVLGAAALACALALALLAGSKVRALAME